jgi:hypothetical protein
MQRLGHLAPILKKGAGTPYSPRLITAWNKKKVEQVRTSPTKVKIALHHLTIRIPTTLNGSIKVLAARGVKGSRSLYT